ncbi:oligosaccharide flippase family protein [Bradyrhizobium liaoningense]|uniref:oligosaccharide flippase family protein n=1 Tax=Bradyrhizobium liaoningense TaxID=43992 RepID=UPI0004B705B4|nr:oligosaccharide flippase family protein [Bradyrhizobium liaoningense]
MRATVTRQAIASLADVVIQGVALAFLYGYLLRSLGSDQVGLWAVVFSIAAIGRGADLGLSRGLIRYLPLQTDAPRRSPDLVDSAVVGTLVLLAPLGLVSAAALWFLIPLSVQASVHEAQALVPWALVLLAVMTMGQVYLNALTAVFRTDQRSYANITATLVMLSATVSLVPVYGLLGVAWAQIIQHVVSIAVSALHLKRSLPGFRFVPRRAGRKDMRLLFAYGLKLHVAGLAMLVFEPATRIILARVETLDAVAYYDMASRLLQQARNLIVMANQVMSPYFARLSALSRVELLAAYRSALSMTLFFSLPTMAFLVVSAPLIAILWIGKSNDSFVVFVAVLSVGWTINILSAPSYFLATAAGYLSPVIVSHLLISVGSSVLAYAFSLLAGERGVVVGVTSGLVVGSVWCMRMVHANSLGGSEHLWRPSDLRFAILCVVAPIASLTFYFAMRASLGTSTSALAGLAGGTLVIGLAVLTNPSTRLIRDSLLPSLKRHGGTKAVDI